MPWKEATKMELRTEFVILADQPSTNMAQLCRRFNISRKTGYKWLRRYRKEGMEGLKNRSRQPHHSPNKTPLAIEQAVVNARRQHPGWGGRKLRHWLYGEIKEEKLSLDPKQIPAASTITAILDRRGLLDTADSPGRQSPWKRFEYPEPNDLWQMDFKGEFAMDNTALCYPLTIIDDHSRYSLALDACPNQKRNTVKGHLIHCFRRYGMPAALLCDNGPPWGSVQGPKNGRPTYTKLGAWLIRLGIQLIYSTPGRPQGKGKNERFNGTLKAELLRFRSFTDLRDAQNKFNRWWTLYNSRRAHESLDMKVPGTCYRPSKHSYPEQLPAIEYGPADHVRKVTYGGFITFKGTRYRVGKAFIGQPVALRPEVDANQWKVFYCHQQIRTITCKKV